MFTTAEDFDRRQLLNLHRGRRVEPLPGVLVDCKPSEYTRNLAKALRARAEYVAGYGQAEVRVHIDGGGYLSGRARDLEECEHVAAQIFRELIT